MKKKRASTKSSRLATKLKKIRLALGLSQSEILERLGFANQLFRSNISQYEHGRRVPSPRVLLSYARLAKIDLAILIDDDLDLPESIPSSTKSLRVKRRVSVRSKKS